MNDLISRQAAIDALIAEGRNVDSRYLEYERIIHEDDAVEVISMLPSAKPKTGEWYIREYEYFTCSECGDDYWNGCDCTDEAKERLRNGDYPNFCPNCGANMRGEQDE